MKKVADICKNRLRDVSRCDIVTTSNQQPDGESDMKPWEQWNIGFRPFAKPTPGFVILRVMNGRAEHVQDDRTGDDAIFETKADAVRALNAINRAARPARQRKLAAV